jgi:choline dehydrogenase-like flavoprotein
VPRYQEPDVLIVGAGASGAAVAWYLARSGFTVTCLEQGGWVDPAAMPHRRADWELARMGEWNPDPNVRALPQDYPLNNRESAITPLMYNAVGGSTIVWGAHFPRYHPSDFRTRSLDGVGDDWPLTYEELEPWYDLNDRVFGVAGLDSDPAYPAKPKRPTAPVPLGRYGATIARGFDRLGWHWWPAEAGVVTEHYGSGRHACNHCGGCGVGCPIGAKSSADVSYWPLALKLGAELRTGCRVREVTVDANGLARGVLYRDADGRLAEQRASAVVMACNGVGTPRILLSSRSRLFPDGLANRSGLVGKNLMFHAYSTVWGVFDEPLDGYKGPPANAVYSHEFYETDARRGFARGFQLQVARVGAPLATALGHSALLPPGERLPWGAEHHRVYAERFNRTLNVSMNGEDLPETCNEVALDPVLTDSDGIPAPLVRYRLSEHSRRMIRFAVERSKEVLVAAGARQTFVPDALPTAGFHLMGTCRMGDAPYGSVVDRWGRAHDVGNLFVVDGSVFVTSGGVNPTPTIQALALRTADWIAKNGRNLPRGS